MRSWREAVQFLRRPQNYGQSWRGPISDMSPRSTLSWLGSSSRDVRRRNAPTRVIRESFRLHQHELPALDLVVSARARARGASSALLRAQLEPLWREVRNKCAASHSS